MLNDSTGTFPDQWKLSKPQSPVWDEGNTTVTICPKFPEVKLLLCLQRLGLESDIQEQETGLARLLHLPRVQSVACFIPKQMALQDVLIIGYHSLPSDNLTFLSCCHAPPLSLCSCAHSSPSSLFCLLQSTCFCICSSSSLHLSINTSVH